MQLPWLHRKPKREAILTGLLAGVKRSDVGEEPDSDKSLYRQFIDFMLYVNLRVRYNSQQKSLTALLNKVFDASLKRIYLVTSSDIIEHLYGKHSGEMVVTIYGKKGGESGAAIYGHRAPEFNNVFDGYVYVPYDLVEQEAEIKSWVNYNLFLGQSYKIIYF